MRRSFYRLAAALVAAALVGTVHFGRTSGSRAPAVTLVATADAGLLDDPIGHIWRFFKDQVFGKISALITGPIEAAKRGLQDLIDRAKNGLVDLFTKHVLQPAIEWALSKIFPGGQAGLEKLKNAVQRFFGAVDGMIQRVEGWAEAALAIAEGSPTRLRSAQEKFNAVLEKLKSFNLQTLLDILLPLAREKLEEFVKSKVLDLLERAWSIVERPIEAGKTAAVSAIGSIPVIGGAISGVVNGVITTGLKVLRDAAFDFIGTKAAELASMALDRLAEWVRKGAAAADAWLQPAYRVLRGLLDRAQEYVGPILRAYENFKGTFAELSSMLSDPKKLGEMVARKIGGILEEKLLEPLIGFVKKPIAQARALVEKGIEALQQAVPAMFEEKVVQPALAWAGERFLGTQGAASQGERIANDVAQALSGTAEKAADFDGVAMQVMQAILRRSAGEVAAGEARVQRRLDALARLTDAQIIDGIIARVKDRIVLAVQARAGEMLEAGFGALDGALGKLREAGRKLLEGIPLVGKTIAGLADALIQQNLRRLASRGLDYLATTAAGEIRSVIDRIADAAKGGAAAVAKPVQGLIGMVKSLAGLVRKKIGVERKALEDLLAKIRAAKQRLLAPVARATGQRR